MPGWTEPEAHRIDDTCDRIAEADAKAERYERWAPPPPVAPPVVIEPLPRLTAMQEFYNAEDRDREMRRAAYHFDYEDQD